MNSIAASSHSISASAARPEARVAPSAPQGAGAKGLAALLLAAVVAAMVVVADQLIDTWADGHVFLVWVILWALVFAATLVFAGTARRMAQRLMVVLNRWSQEAAQRRAEARMWEIAKSDPRVMGELVAAQQRVPASQADATESDPLAVQSARDRMASRGRYVYYV